MRAWARVVMSCGLLIGALLILQLRSTGEAVPIRRPLASLSSVVGEWQGREVTALDTKVLRNLKLDDYIIRRYADQAGRSVGLYVGYWGTQRRGALIHSPQNCLPGTGWEPVEAARVTVPLPAPHGPITVNRYLVQKDREMQVVLYWYQAQGRATAGDVSAKIEMVRSAVTHNRTDAALVRVSSPVYGGQEATTDLLVRYVQSLYPLLAEHLPG